MELKTFFSGKQQEPRRQTILYMKYTSELSELCQLLNKNKKSFLKKMKRWADAEIITLNKNKKNQWIVKPKKATLNIALGKTFILPYDVDTEPEKIRGLYEPSQKEKTSIQKSLNAFETNPDIRLHNLIYIFDCLKPGELPAGPKTPRGRTSTTKPLGNWYAIPGFIGTCYFELLCGLKSNDTGYKLKLHLPPQYATKQIQAKKVMAQAARQIKQALRLFCKKYNWSFDTKRVDQRDPHYAVLVKDEHFAGALTPTQITKINENTKFTIDYSATWQHPITKEKFNFPEIEYIVKPGTKDENQVQKDVDTWTHTPEILRKIETRIYEQDKAINYISSNMNNVFTSMEGIKAQVQAGIPGWQQTAGFLAIAKDSANYQKRMYDSLQSHLVDLNNELQVQKKQFYEIIKELKNS